MALNSPINGYSPDSSFFGKTSTFSVGEGTPVYSPIPGTVSIEGSTLKVVSSEQKYTLAFDKLNPRGLKVVNGSNVTPGSLLGYTGPEKLEFTVYDKSKNKIDASNFLKKTNLSDLIGAGAVGLGLTSNNTGKNKLTTDSGTSLKPSEVPFKKVQDSPLFRAVTGIGLLPFHAASKIANIDSVSEGVSEEKENLINEEIERIKKLMK